MNDTATQTQTYSGYDDEIGAGESRPSNRIYVNIRCGDIAQTSNKHIDGYEPVTTTNKSGTEYHFFAKKHPHLTGHIVDIQWHTHKLKDGTVLTGWNIFIDVGQPKIFVLSIGANDGPYSRLMATLPGVEFTKPVRIVGFMGDYKGKPQKVLLLSQQKGQDGKPIWLQPQIEAKWLSKLIYNKVKEGIELSPEEERNVSRNADGSFNSSYPYITERADGKWSFDRWEDHLHEQMKEFVIPSVKDACRVRGYSGPIAEEQSGSAYETPADAAQYSGPVASGSVVDDSDIPF